jgi:hypothetical protein
VPGWVELVAAICGMWVTFLTALALTARTRAARWLWARLIAEPITKWFRAEVECVVEPIRAELQTNGGASLKDAIVRIEHRQAWIVEQMGRGE